MSESLQRQLGAGDGFWVGYESPSTPVRRIPEHMPNTDDMEYLDGYVEGFMRGQNAYTHQAWRDLKGAIMDAYGITALTRLTDRIVRWAKQVRKVA